MPKYRRTETLDGDIWSAYGNRFIVRSPVTFEVLPNDSDVPPIEHRYEVTCEFVDGEVVCSSVSIQQLEGGPPIETDAIRRVTPRSWIRSALPGLSIVGKSIPADGWAYSSVNYRLPPDETFQDINDLDALDKFSDLWAFLKLLGLAPTTFLNKEYGMPRTTASRWAKRARATGILKDDHEKLSGWDADA